jgi:phosphomethylpyrimidine synthase
VREFAKLQNQDSAGFVAAEEAEKGMAEMSKVYDETGRELYMGAGGREHD